MTNVFEKLDNLKSSGSMLIDIYSTFDGYWCVTLAQNFGESETMFYDEDKNLEHLLLNGIKFIEKGRKRRKWNVY